MANTTQSTSKSNVAVALAVLSDPSLAGAAVEQLNTQIQEQEAKIAAENARLEQLRKTREAFTGPVATTPAPARRRPGRPAGSTNGKARRSTGKVGRPSGPGADHGGAIMAALKGKRSGLTLAELHEAVVADKHPIEKKTVATYLSNMVKGGQLVKDGERMSFRYKVAPTK